MGLRHRPATDDGSCATTRGCTTARTDERLRSARLPCGPRLWHPSFVQHSSVGTAYGTCVRAPECPSRAPARCATLAKREREDQLWRLPSDSADNGAGTNLPEMQGSWRVGHLRSVPRRHYPLQAALSVLRWPLRDLPCQAVLRVSREGECRYLRPVRAP